MPEDVWELVCAERTIARLVVTGSDFPWLHARLEPHDGFNEVRPMFEAELRLLDHIDDHSPPGKAPTSRYARRSASLNPTGTLSPSTSYT
jgi:hypothetical protein